MVNSNQSIAPGKIAAGRDQNQPRNFLPSRHQKNDKQDELIMSLAERYENRRARQVGEWERLYGENVYRTF